MMNKRSFKDRFARNSGSSIRRAEIQNRADEYDLAEYDHWDPAIRAEWNRQDAANWEREKAIWQAAL